MLVFFQGQFVPEEQARVSIFDRATLYGDGLFETLRVFKGHPLQWAAHLNRLWRSAESLGISIPYSQVALAQYTQELLRLNTFQNGVLRIHLSRGIGPRGYSPRGADQPWAALSLHHGPAGTEDHPARWRLVTSTLRQTTAMPLAACKSCNKLLHVLARAEADALGADEALLLDASGSILEGASSNIFWVRRGTLHTPSLKQPILGGTTRALVLELCQNLKIAAAETDDSRDALNSAEGIFLTLSTRGIVEVTSLDGQEVPSSELTHALYAAYQRWAEAEAGGS